jgi:hypothetical protein
LKIKVILFDCSRYGETEYSCTSIM